MAFQIVQVQLSIAYHPQTNGQNEIVNKCLETFFTVHVHRCFSGLV